MSQVPLLAPPPTVPSAALTPEGANNSDWQGTQDRLIKGHSYKDCGVIAIVPTRSGLLDHRFVSAWEGLIKAPNHPFCRFTIANMEVGDAYNRAIYSIITNPQLMAWNSGKGPIILTVEDDQIVSPDSLMKLLGTFHSTPYAAVSGLYFTKGGGGSADTPIGGCAQIWGAVTDFPPNYAPQIPRAGEVQECRGIGMGFALWDIAQFLDPRTQQGKNPDGTPIWFKTWNEVDQNGVGRVGTQDLSYCDLAQKAGYRFAVDTNVRIGHLDRTSGWIF